MWELLQWQTTPKFQLEVLFGGLSVVYCSYVVEHDAYIREHSGLSPCIEQGFESSECPLEGD